MRAELNVAAENVGGRVGGVRHGVSLGGACPTGRTGGLVCYGLWILVCKVGNMGEVLRVLCAEYGTSWGGFDVLVEATLRLDRWRNCPGKV